LLIRFWIDEFEAVRIARVEPAMQGLRAISRAFFEADNGVVGGFQTIIRDGHYGCSQAF